MNNNRIEEIQKETACSDSISVQQALLKVWNETEQSNKNNKFTGCHNCDHYETCDEDNYPCNKCSHNYSDMFSTMKDE